MLDRIPAKVRAKILCWTQHVFVCHEPGLFDRNEAFLFIDGADYYVFASKDREATRVHIKLLRTLNDLPAIHPDDVPADVFVRLEKNTRIKLGWIRRSLPAH